MVPYFFVIVSNFDPGQNIQQGMPGEEGAGKVHQIGNHLVPGVGPEEGELKAIAGFLLLALSGILDGIKSGGVGVVLGIGAVGDHESLDVFKQAQPAQKESRW